MTKSDQSVTKAVYLNAKLCEATRWPSRSGARELYISIGTT